MWVNIFETHLSTQTDPDNSHPLKSRPHYLGEEGLVSVVAPSVKTLHLCSYDLCVFFIVIALGVDRICEALVHSEGPKDLTALDLTSIESVLKDSMY